MSIESLIRGVVSGEANVEIKMDGLHFDGKDKKIKILLTNLEITVEKGPENKGFK